MKHHTLKPRTRLHLHQTQHNLPLPQGGPNSSQSASSTGLPKLSHTDGHYLRGGVSLTQFHAVKHELSWAELCSHRVIVFTRIIQTILLLPDIMDTKCVYIRMCVCIYTVYTHTHIYTYICQYESNFKTILSLPTHFHNPGLVWAPIVRHSKCLQQAVQLSGMFSDIWDFSMCCGSWNAVQQWERSSGSP